MRHGTFDAMRSVVAGMIAVALLAGAVPAFAQVTTNTLIVACKGTNCAGLGGAANSPYTELQTPQGDGAIDDAIALSATVGRVTVLIVEDDTGAPWSGTALTIPADADIRLLGVPDDPDVGGAFSVVLEGTGAAPVITIDGQDLTEATDRLEIEGITLTGGTDGVLVTGTTDAGNATAYQPVINRCYITANTENGVRVEGNGAPLLVNDSINLNGEDGVHVGDGLGGVGAFADLLHCDSLENGNNGVYVETGNDARVRNSIVYRNGDADGEGGLVWQANAFINPDQGPVAGGTQVTINGTNFGASPQVFFGPPNHNGGGHRACNVRVTDRHADRLQYTARVDRKPRAGRCLYRAHRRQHDPGRPQRVYLRGSCWHQPLGEQCRSRVGPANRPKLGLRLRSELRQQSRRAIRRGCVYEGHLA